MEVFLNEILPVIIFVLSCLGCFLGGIMYAKKKFQPHDEAPKVGKHKEYGRFPLNMWCIYCKKNIAETHWKDDCKHVFKGKTE